MSKLIKPQNNFTTIPNHIINDKRLSFKSKGLFLYLISKPDGWSFSSDRIVNDCNDGLKSVKSGLIELETLGLLTRHKVRIGGVFKGYDYVLSFDFSPSTQNGTTVSPLIPFASTEKPLADNGSSYKDSLSKKDKAIEEEREPYVLDGINYDEMIEDLENVSSSDLICSSVEDYPLIEQYLDFVSKKCKHPIFYRASVRTSLMNDSDKNHNRTFFAYTEFSNTRPDLSQNGVLPVGVNIFDIIGRD